MTKGKRIIALIMIFTMIMVTGCSSKSFDEYLETLGIKDSEYDNTATETGGEADASVADTASVVEGDDDTYTETKSEKVEEQGIGAGIEKVVREVKSLDIKGRQADKEALGLTEEGIAKIKEEQKDLFYYNKLTEAGKTLYVEILVIMQNQAENIPLSYLVDNDMVDYLFYCVMYDHPEIFWVDGYTFTKNTLKNGSGYITFQGRYTCDMNEVEARKVKINEYVNECLANAPSSDDDYYAIKYVYDYIVEHTEYDADAPDDQNICSVFIGGRSVCNGYAKATQYLLNKLGIECIFVTGTANTKTAKGIKHAWNLVKCNDAYYYVDTTWGDAFSDEDTQSALTVRNPSVYYDYLNVTTDYIEKCHVLSDFARFPECNSMTDNYFVREDEYFKTADITLVKDLIDRRVKEGRDNATMKCADKEVYDSLYNLLFEEREIFNALPEGKNNVADYTAMPDSDIIIIWLDD